MEHYAGLDVSLELSSVCILDAQGRIICETKVPSDPDDLVRYFRSLEQPITRIALEAGPLSQWIHAGLSAAGLEAVLLETRHVKAALSAMMVKTDRRDARGIAQLLRLGWYRPGARQVGKCPGGAFAAHRAQAHPGQAARHRVRHARGMARLWPQGRTDQPRPLRSAHPGAGRRSHDAHDGIEWQPPG